jgi:hypothetical protein
MSQFKGFAYQQGQFLAREIKDQAVSGTTEGRRRALRKAATLLAIAPLVGEEIGNVRAMILGRERDKKGFDRYMENLGYAGGLGLVLDMVNSLEYDPKSFLLGPSASTAAEVGMSAKRALGRAAEKGEGPTAAEKRTFIRALPGGSVVANRVAPTKKESTRKKGRPARPDNKARPARKERSQ